jgi:hypothetical protein
MDEKYVQEHILTGGIVVPVGGASPTHSWPFTAISLGVVASYRHICTVLDEFSRIAFRKKIYLATDELQADLDVWLVRSSLS